MSLQTSQHSSGAPKPPALDSGKNTSPNKNASRDAEKSSSYELGHGDEIEITYPEGGLAAWIVVIGSWCSLTASLGLVNSVGVFQAYVSTSLLPSYSASAIGWISGIYVFVTYFCGVQIGPIFDARGPRVLLAVGSVCLLVGIFTLSVCTQYYQFILALSVISGVGTSLLFSSSMAAISHWFDAKRGTASGFAFTGSGFGGVLFPLMMQSLLPEVGWAWSTRSIGFVLLFQCVVSVALCRSRLPPKRGVATSSHDTLPETRIFWDGTGAMTVTTAGVFFVEWAYFVPVSYVPSYYLARQGLSDKEAVTGSAAFAYQLLAILNAASCFGRYLPGYMADEVGRYNTIIVTILLCLVAVMGLWLPDALADSPPSVALMIVFVVLFGFASGSNISLTPICIGQLCDTQEFGRYYASAYFIVSFGCLTAIPIAGKLIKATGEGGRRGYWGVILFTGLSYVAAFVCFFWVRVRMKQWNWRTRW